MMFNFFFFFFAFFLLSGVLFSLTLLFKQSNLSKLKNEVSPFECGFLPSHFLRLSFSLRFFMIALIFLVFDIEVTILLPIIFVNDSIHFFMLFFFFFFCCFAIISGFIFWVSTGSF